MIAKKVMYSYPVYDMIYFTEKIMNSENGAGNTGRD
jgi:hypothetical protein